MQIPYKGWKNGMEDMGLRVNVKRMIIMNTGVVEGCTRKVQC